MRLNAPRVRLDEDDVVGDRGARTIRRDRLLSGPRPATRLIGFLSPCSSHQLYKLCAKCHASCHTLSKSPAGPIRRGAISRAPRVGSLANGVGCEATQRRGRHDAVQRDARDPHAHAQDRRAGCVERRGLSTSTCSARVAYPRLHGAGAAALSARRHPAEAASPDVGGERPTSTSTTTFGRRAVPAPGGRRELDQLIGEIASTPLDRDHPLWEMYVAEGLADNRDRDHPQGPSRAGRRCRVGQPDGDGDGSRTNPRCWAMLDAPVRAIRGRRNLLKAAAATTWG